MKGTYILVISVSYNTYIQIGRLGSRYFKKGLYFYVGSAMGNSGSSTLENRVRRHLKLPDRKKKHWHIDYLLENEGANIIKLYLIPSVQKLECRIVQELLNVSDGYIKKFGSSDCNCQSHLIYFKNNKDCFLKKK